jgi:O-antigen/teichoic acid export membrane protein
LIVAGLIIPFSVHQMLVAGLQTLDNRVTHQFKAGTIAAVAQVAMLTALTLFTDLSVLSVLFANAATVFITWSLTLGRVDAPRVIGHVDWTLLRHSLRHAIVLHVGMCFFFLHLRLDLFMLGALTDKASVGQYSVAVMLAETVQLVTDSLAIALVPRQVGNTVQEAALVALRGARINLLVGLALASGWVLVGYPLIVVLLGHEFAPAYKPLVALLPGILFMGMQRVCGPAVLRTGRPAWMTAIFGAALAMNVGLNAWFIPWWGATGAGLASTVSYAFGAALFLWWTSRLANVPLARALPTARDAIELATVGWTMTRQFVKRGTNL